MDVKVLWEIPSWEWPEDGPDVVLAALGDTELPEADRLLAAELAGDYAVINDELAQALLKVFQDDAQSDELRATAAIAFGPALESADTADLMDPEDAPISEGMFRRIQGALRRIHDDPGQPKLVRRRALEASVRATEVWHAMAVRRAYAEADPDWRLTAAFCMQFVRGFEKEIAESLNDADPLVFREALAAAGSWEIGAGWSHAAALIRSPDTDKDLLLVAIEAAAGIHAEKAKGLLGPLLLSKDEDIADAAHEALLLSGGLDDFEGEH